MSVWNPEAMLDPHKRQSKISRLADVNRKEKTCMSLATIMSTPRGGADCMYTERRVIMRMRMALLRNTIPSRISQA
jgi:hypothetical protein